MPKVYIRTYGCQIKTINSYDELGRLEWSKVHPTAEPVEFEYDKAGNRTAVIDGEDNRTEIDCDAQNRVLEERYPAVTVGGPVATIRYGYDALNKISRTDGLDRDTEYRYDVRNRLRTVSYVDGAGDPDTKNDNHCRKIKSIC